MVQRILWNDFLRMRNSSFIWILKWEFFRLLKQSRTHYAILALFLIEVIVLVTAYYQGKYIIDLILSNLRESFYLEGNLVNGNLLIYVILNSFWFHVPLILIIVTSGMLTSEYKDGTIKTLMLQNISKRDLILAKYTVAICFTLLVIVLMAISTMLLSYGIFGQGDLVVYFDSLNFFESDDAFKRICGAFVSGSISMVFFNVVSLTLAIFFREPTKTWILSALFLILCTLLLKVDYGWELLNHGLFVKLIDGWQSFFYYQLNWGHILINNLLLIGYSAATMTLGTYIFNKRDIV